MDFITVTDNIGAQRVARRSGSTTLTYFLVDHLGSTSVAVNIAGSVIGRRDYKAWGELRYSWQSVNTTYLYTGQKDEPSFGLTSQDGLYFYNSRWFDPTLGRFLQADSVVSDPGSSVAFDRYAYCLNNPIAYNDPLGHEVKPMVYGREPVVSRADLLFSLSIKYPPELKQNQPHAQYYEIPGDSNLCGHISLLMAYRYTSGNDLTLGIMHYWGVNNGKVPFNGGMDFLQLGITFSNFFTEGWMATVINWETTYFYGGNFMASRHNSGNVCYKKDTFGLIADAIWDGNIVIAAVMQQTDKSNRLGRNKSSVKHWCVVTGIGPGFVVVQNPFWGGEQIYSWDNFYTAFNLELIIISQWEDQAYQNGTVK